MHDRVLRDMPDAWSNDDDGEEERVSSCRPAHLTQNKFASLLLCKAFPHPRCGGGIGGVSHMLKRLTNIIRRIAESPSPFVVVFVVALLAPLCKNSLIVRRHIGQKESKDGEWPSKRSRSVVCYVFFC